MSFNPDDAATLGPGIRVEDWRLELRNKAFSLAGTVFGHPDPKIEDGSTVHSSAITKADGLEATTTSGKVYSLGTMNPEYAARLKNLGIQFDPRNPLADLEAMGRAALPYKKAETKK